MLTTLLCNTLAVTDDSDSQKCSIEKLIHGEIHASQCDAGCAMCDECLVDRFQKSKITVKSISENIRASSTINKGFPLLLNNITPTGIAETAQIKTPPKD